MRTELCVVVLSTNMLTMGVDTDVLMQVYMGAGTGVRYLEATQNRGRPLLQVIPPLVPIMHHLAQTGRGVGAVLPGQAPVLLVDEL